jgi:superfamily II DNA or RNA helicase
MNLKLTELAWKSVYTTSDHNFHKDFFIPALERSTHYDRGVGYFTSRWIQRAAYGIARFAKNGGKARWITSPILNKEDYEMFSKLPEEHVTAELERITAISVAELTANMQIDARRELGRLIAAGVIDIRLALPKGTLEHGDFHDKFGIFTDSFGNMLSFNGSYNDSAHADINYESIRTFVSWKPDLSDCVSEDKARFERLWTGSDPRVRIYNLPSAVKSSIIRFQSHTSPSAPPMKKHGALNTLPQDRYRLMLWPHQKKAFSAFFENKSRGVIEMATGTGKTKLALAICEKFIHEGLAETIIVSADGIDLLNQWHAELLSLTQATDPRWTVLRQYDNYKQAPDFRVQPARKILLASRYFLPESIKNAKVDVLSRCLLIHDEVHRLGSESNRKDLAAHGAKMIGVLGLSATPEREWDEEGNLFINAEVGEVIYKFGIKDALLARVLCPFKYTPIDYKADEDDAKAIQGVYRLRAARANAGNPMSDTEFWIQLARVYKVSRAKLAPFDQFLKENSHVLKNCIIFVEDKAYGDLVMNIIHKYCLSFKSYFAEEDRETLRLFASGKLSCLVTCHRLSEGIDIRSLENVVIFSSARARLETIQRIGRILRVDPENKSKVSHVVDFIRTRNNEDDEDPEADSSRKIWLSDLSKAGIDLLSNE